MYNGSITDVQGVLVGQVSDRAACTGVTAVLTLEGAVAGVDVRGGGPGTRETDSMQPGRLVDKIHAILLSGGSAYGLDAAGGAMRVLENWRVGYDVGVGKVPIVGQAVLFDLAVGSGKIRPDSDMGAAACLNAGKTVRQGRVGAGCGATVGKLVPGMQMDSGGVGTASVRLPGGAVLGAIVAVNAAGDVYHPETGAFLAGARDAEGKPRPAIDQMLKGQAVKHPLGNTTIGVLATDAIINREQANRLALLGHDGYARTIRPVHMPVDGDTIFALSSARVECDYMLLCSAAAEVMARAIANAVEAGRV